MRVESRVEEEGLVAGHDLSTAVERPRARAFERAAGRQHVVRTVTPRCERLLELAVLATVQEAAEQAAENAAARLARARADERCDRRCRRHHEECRSSPHRPSPSLAAVGTSRTLVVRCSKLIP